MKKTTSKNLTKRLVQYGALSAAALGVADAAGQVVYVDIDPDQVLNVGDEFALDILDTGLTNFTFNNPDGLGNGNAAIVFPSSGGAFVGITASSYQYPALLAEGDMIDGASGFTTPGQRGDLNYYGCAYSNSQWCNTVVDGYLGVRFENLGGGTTHYGWVRLDTDVNGSNVMVVKDFAFNATPDEGLMAGEVGLGLGESTFNGFSYLVDSNNSLNLKAATSMDNVVLHNVLGQQVLTQKLSSINESISLVSLETGIYIATVSIEGQTKSFKVVKR